MDGLERRGLSTLENLSEFSKNTETTLESTHQQMSSARFQRFPKAIGWICQLPEFSKWIPTTAEFAGFHLMFGFLSHRATPGTIIHFTLLCSIINHILDCYFPWNQPSSCGGTTMTTWKPSSNAPVTMVTALHDMLYLCWSQGYGARCSTAVGGTRGATEFLIETWIKFSGD